MKSLRIDLGSEFDNKDVTELVERYGIEVDPTPGGAHWAGGVDRGPTWHSRRMICATVSETGLPMEDVLVGCIIATNTMGQVHGFTPEQHAFGKNRTNIVSFSPPSMVDYTTVPMEHQNSITNRLHAMQVARDMHHKCSLKESLYRAMRLNVRNVDFVGNIGDKVWFWRDPKFKGDQTWRGPGVICGKDDIMYMIRMAGGYLDAIPTMSCIMPKG
jgi:hypothetical protein